TLTVLDAQQGISLITSQVNALVSSGVLNSGNGQALTVKLDSATTSLNAGNTTAGVNQLNAFINQVTAFANSGKLTAAEAQLLIDEANQVISAASGGAAHLVVDAPSNPAAGDTVPVSHVGELVIGSAVGVYLDNSAGNVTAAEEARFQSALNTWNTTFG